jgi:hypothetical protein
MLDMLAGSPVYVGCLKFWLSWLAGYAGYTGWLFWPHG